MELRSRRVISASSPDGVQQHRNCVSDDDISHISHLSDEDTYVPSYNSDSDSCSDEGWNHVDLNGASSSNLGARREKKRRSDNVGESGLQHEGNNRGNGEQKSVDQSGDRKRKAKKEDKPTLMWEVWEEENERWLDAHLSEDTDLDGQNAVLEETVEAPSNLTMPLLRYQKEWLAWALKQEESPIRGGILADEMGMGKTIQAIALVLAKKEICRTHGEDNIPSTSAGGPSTILPETSSTLVVCPLVAVKQWESEINRFTLEGSTKVLIYHGASRGKNLKNLFEYDFVITTYSIVESEYRKFCMPDKQRCCYCGKKFNQKKLSYHLMYFCGPNAVKTEQQSKQQKKVVKNLQTKSKLGTKISGDNVSITDGGDMKKVSHRRSLKRDRDVDNVNSISGNLGVSRWNSLLHSVRWKRIILDEAHYVKDRRCNTAKAVFALDSSYKWALSGTPLQNRVGELYSLVRFLQIVPYSYYLCKDCDCRTLDYSSTTQCPNCPHKTVRHFCWWNKYIATPIRDYVHLDNGRRAMILLKHKILKNIVLRRTKKGRAADLALPPRIVTLRRDTLDIKEEDYYEALYNESQAQFNTYVQAGTVTNNYAHIFDLLTRLRQAVDHPYLVVYSKAANVAPPLQNGSMTDADSYEQTCGLCHEPAEDPVVTACKHLFCKTCLINYTDSLGEALCPGCSSKLTVDLTRNGSSQAQSKKAAPNGFRSSSILNRIKLDDFQTSTKIDALREEIRFMIERDGSAKAIVFSQFTSFLDLINYSLQKCGIKCVQLVGSMTMTAREAAIKQFTDDPDCRIFLMSLKAGGVALNLTVASHVFLMDPWWNPAVERQAQDRIHRIGQYKPIRIVRFVIENTVEERILKLQEKKELVFEGTVGGCPEALGKLTEADMKFLFIT